MERIDKDELLRIQLNMGLLKQDETIGDVINTGETFNRKYVKRNNVIVELKILENGKHGCKD